MAIETSGPRARPRARPPNRSLKAGRARDLGPGRLTREFTGADRERRLLRGLLEASAGMHETLTLDQMLQRIADILARAGGFQAAAVYLLDAGTGLLHARAIVGVSEANEARMRSSPIPLRGYLPLMRPEMRVSRSFVFDHRRHQMPEDSRLDSSLSIPELAPDWREGQWHPLDSLTIPLEDGRGRVHGLLSLDRPEDHEYPDQATIQALELFADQCVAAIARTELYSQLEQRAMTDSLTGLHDRQVLDDALARELLRAARSGLPCSLLFLDLDHFKRVNDAFGHAAGDQLLQQLAAALRQRLRRGDLAARYGGEEFVVLLPETTADHAEALANEIRSRIARAPSPCALTASVRVATCSPGELDGSRMLARADSAMYEAKRRGRNQVVGVEREP